MQLGNNARHSASNLLVELLHIEDIREILAIDAKHLTSYRLCRQLQRKYTLIATAVRLGIVHRYVQDGF